MAEKTVISWTDHTVNFWMGCRRVSPGCQNCYAERMTRDRMGLKLWGNAPRQRTKTPWQNVLKWNRESAESNERKKAFCGSLCDFFEDHPTCNKVRPDAWDIIRRCDSMDWQLLTKRPENIAANLPPDWNDGWSHVWLGTSIENNDYVHRAETLRAIPAAVRFVSYEPALGPISDIDLTDIHWLIYGGESGPGYRAENKDWAREIRNKAGMSGTAFYHKQSAGYRTELGVELDGEIVQEMPSAIVSIM